MQNRLSPQQQQEYAQKFNDEMERIIMSWDNELRDWYPTAIKALDFLSVRDIGMPQERFIDLFNEEKQGLNMNVVMVLCNNLESVTASQMGMNAKHWAEFLLINSNVASRWNSLSMPAQKKLMKEYEIMNNRPPILKSVIGEA